MKSWPVCFVKMRDGSEVEGFAPDIRSEEVTVKLPAQPKMIPTNFDLKSCDFIYRDIPIWYVRFP